MPSLFLQLLAIQMLIDFLPVPWKGKIGLFRSKPIAGGTTAALIAFAAIMPQNEGDSLIRVFYLGILLSLAYGLSRSILWRSAGFRRRTGAEHAAVLLAISALTAFILPLVFPLIQKIHPQPLPVGSVSAAIPAAVLAGYAIGYLFSLGVGGLIVGSLLSKLQHEISEEEIAERHENAPHPAPAAATAQASAGEPATAADTTATEDAQDESDTGRPAGQRGLASPNSGNAPDTSETLQIEEGIRYAGRLIGFFEAFIVTTLVIVGQWEAIGFIMAAKAIGRYRQMNVRRFSEYFLIGTFANVSIAIIGGLLVHLLVSLR